MDDSSEAARSSLFLSIAGFFELGFKLFYVAFDLNRKRKSSLLRGITILGLLMFLIGYLEYEGEWEYCRYLIILVFMDIGFVTGSYFSVLPEYFPQNIVGLTNGINNLLQAISAFAFPCLILK